MKLVLLTDSEHHLVKHIIGGMLKRGQLGPPSRELLATISRAPDFVVPPRLVPMAVGGVAPYDRGKRRSVKAVIYSTPSHPVLGVFDVLLLSCGHLVTRHSRGGATWSYCEACGHCQETPLPKEPT